MRNVLLRLTYLTTWFELVVLYSNVMVTYRLAGESPLLSIVFEHL